MTTEQLKALQVLAHYVEGKLWVVMARGADGSTRTLCLVCSNRAFRTPKDAAMRYATEHKHSQGGGA